MQISCPLITKKKEKKWKNSPVNSQKKSPKFRTFFQQWRVFYNLYCNIEKSACGIKLASCWMEQTAGGMELVGSQKKMTESGMGWKLQRGD
jgi:hypothetical protein